MNFYKYCGRHKSMSGTHSRDLGLDHISYSARFCNKIKSPSNSEESSFVKEKTRDSFKRGHVPWEINLGSKIKEVSITGVV